MRTLPSSWDYIGSCCHHPSVPEPLDEHVIGQVKPKKTALWACSFQGAMVNHPFSAPAHAEPHSYSGTPLALPAQSRY